MIGIDLEPELERFVDKIATRTMYYGNPIPKSIMKLIEVEITDYHDGVLGPRWLGVLEHGRGPRKSDHSSGLINKIYAWMERRHMFKSKDPAHRIKEARFITWYINKYGNKQFRNKVFVDVYTRARDETVQEIINKFDITLDQITMKIL